MCCEEWLIRSQRLSRHIHQLSALYNLTPLIAALVVILRCGVSLQIDGCIMYAVGVDAYYRVGRHVSRDGCEEERPRTSSRVRWCIDGDELALVAFNCDVRRYEAPVRCLLLCALDSVDGVVDSLALAQLDRLVWDDDGGASVCCRIVFRRWAYDKQEVVIASDALCCFYARACDSVFLYENRINW